MGYEDIKYNYINIYINKKKNISISNIYNQTKNYNSYLYFRYSHSGNIYFIDKRYCKKYYGFFDNGNLLEKGDKHIKLAFHKNGNIAEKWYSANRNYTDYNNEPAMTTYFLNGKIKKITHLKNGDLHNESGPAIVRYKKNGDILSQKWFLEHNYMGSTEKLFKKYIIKRKNWFPELYESLLKKEAETIFD